jgi:hypothetical protein
MERESGIRIVAGIDARCQFLVAQRDRERRTLESIERDVTVMTCFPSAMVDLAIRQFDTELLWLADLRRSVAGAAVRRKREEMT